MYGISVYVADLAAAEQTCAEAHDQGFDRLFTSLHIPEDDPSALPRLLRRLASIAHRNQLALVADISGRTLQALGLDASSVGELRGWGVYGPRIDFGIDHAQIVAMSRSLPVYLTARSPSPRPIYHRTRP